jgi:hypothetical protein
MRESEICLDRLQTYPHFINTLQEKTSRIYNYNYTEYTQTNGAVSIVKTIETAPLFCVYPVLLSTLTLK